MRRNDIDVYKGILVWLVVISHIMAVSVNLYNTILFRVIVNSHIPLFLGVSGYLFKPEKFKVRKSVQRLIFPWCIANLVYFVLSGQSVSVRGLLFGFETHLWYIPSLILFMTLLWLVEKMHFKKVIYAVLIVVAFAFQFPGLLVGEGIAVKTIRFLVSNFRLQFLIYFLLGNMLRKTGITRQYKKLTVAIAGGIVFLLLAAVTTDKACIAFKLVGNTALMAGLLQNVVTISENSRVLNFLKLSGRNSMFIYLYHVIPLILPFTNLLKIVITVVWGAVMVIVICKKNDSGLWYLLGLN